TKANKTTPFEFDNTEAWGTDSFVLGIMGFCLYVLLVITSLPSVGAALSWREFSFVQSKLGHLTLRLYTTQGFLYGWNKFLRSSTYKWYTPPGYMQCLVLPSVVLLLITQCGPQHHPYTPGLGEGGGRRQKAATSENNSCDDF
ncbi:unnamed protein product, partial [Coregonus sp. 'balchen']